MPSRSPVTQAIDHVVSAGIHPILKERGFKKQGRSFHKPVGDLYHVVHVQSSRHNAFDVGKFTINLGVSSPDIAALWHGEMTSHNPASHAHLLFSTRIRSLLPSEQDHWWTIEPTTDLDRLAQEVGASLAQYGLTYFQNPAFQSTQALLDSLERDALGGIPTAGVEIRAVLLHREGRTDEAQALLAGLIAGKEKRPGLGRYVRRIRALAARLGFTL
jgi:hypothetical protein